MRALEHLFVRAVEKGVASVVAGTRVLLLCPPLAATAFLSSPLPYSSPTHCPPPLLPTALLLSYPLPSPSPPLLLVLLFLLALPCHASLFLPSPFLCSASPVSTLFGSTDATTPTLQAVSVICFVLETMPELKIQNLDPKIEPTSAAAFASIETVCIVIFTLEYIARLLTVTSHPPSKLPWYTKLYKFVFNIMNIIDLAAIIPWYVNQILNLQGQTTDSGTSSLMVIRVLRIVRVFRVFKLGRYSAGMQLFGKVMSKSLNALG